MPRPSLSARLEAAALLLWALLGASVAAAAFMAMVWFHAGQRADFSAFEGRKWTSLELRRFTTVVVRFATPTIVVLTTAVSAVAAQRRRGVAATVAVVTGVSAVVFLARMLKAVLPRDDQLAGTWVGVRNTYPSGHMAALAVVMLIAVAVSPPNRRSLVTALSAGAVSAQTVGLAATGWHRLSDLIGALGIAVAVGAPASMVITGQWRDATVPRAASSWWTRWSGRLAGAGVVLLACSAWFAAGRLLGHPSYGSFGLHTVVTSLIALTGYGVVVIQANLVDAADAASSIASAESPAADSARHRGGRWGKSGPRREA